MTLWVWSIHYRMMCCSFVFAFGLVHSISSCLTWWFHCYGLIYVSISYNIFLSLFQGKEHTIHIGMRWITTTSRWHESPYVHLSSLIFPAVPGAFIIDCCSILSFLLLLIGIVDYYLFSLLEGSRFGKWTMTHYWIEYHLQHRIQSRSTGESNELVMSKDAMGSWAECRASYGAPTPTHWTI